MAARFVVDSAGTGAWHVGDAPDPRSRAVAERHGVRLSGSARRVVRTDFVRFDHLICMDEENRESLLQMGAPSRKLSLLLEHDPAATLLEVPDPYYGGRDGFDTVFGLVDSACEALLQRLLDSSRRPDR